MPNMPRVLGIDTSLTATGLARIDVNSYDADGYVADIVVATVSAPKPNPRDKSKRAMALRVNPLIEHIESAIFDPDNDAPDSPLPDLIAIETLAYAAKGSGVWVLPWIFGRVMELAVKYNIPVVEVGTGQIKKYATGSGVAQKETVMLAVNRRWPEAEISNDNESDAMTAGAIGCDYLGFPIVGTRAKYHGEVLDAIRKSEAKLRAV